MFEREWFIEYLDWEIFLAILLVLLVVIYKNSDYRAKAIVLITVGLGISISLSFIIIIPYNYIMLGLFIIFLAFLLNGKWSERLNKYSDPTLFQKTEPTVWNE